MPSYDKEAAGYVHSVESGGMTDGPGIRYVVFFAGCKLRCQYCHNPDTWTQHESQLMTVEEILCDIRKYSSYFKMSGGGVTISGGEPLAQPQFLLELLKACKSEGIHTILDTAGYAPVDVIQQMLPYTDLLLLDMKSLNPEVYKNVTDVSIDPALNTLHLSHDLNVPIWIRFVLVPGLTDDENDMRNMAAYLNEFLNIERVDVLPFHKLGEYKWTELGLPYTLKDTLPPSDIQLERAREIFSVHRKSQEIVRGVTS